MIIWKLWNSKNHTTWNAPQNCLDIASLYVHTCFPRQTQMNDSSDPAFHSLNMSIVRLLTTTYKPVLSSNCSGEIMMANNRLITPYPKCNYPPRSACPLPRSPLSVQIMANNRHIIRRCQLKHALALAIFLILPSVLTSVSLMLWP